MSILRSLLYVSKSPGLLDSYSWPVERKNK